MNKKLIILIALVAVIAGVFVFLNTPKEKAEEKESISSEEIDKAVALIKANTPDFLTDEFGDFVKKDSLINLVHIRKDESGYKINCYFGPSYESAKLIDMFPDQLVSMGQIRECNAETAKLIDESVRSEEVGCTTFMSNIPPGLNDYYFFAIKVADREVTQDWIDDLKAKWEAQGLAKAAQCFNPMEGMIGQTMAKHGTGVVDLNANLVYY
jgi:hypothetical protein